LAEYGGWGNVDLRSLPGLSLPATAFLAAGQINWRLAIALTGIVAAVYGVFYFFSVQDTPGKVYERSASSQGLEVTTSKDWFML